SAAFLTTSISPVRHAASQVEIPAMNPMPAVVQQLLARVEARRCEVSRQAFWENVKFWSLKAPGMIPGCGAAVIAAMSREFGLPVVILSGLLAICVALDVTLHPGKHRNAHLRAADGLRSLRNSIDLWWIQLNHYSSDDGAAQILARAEKQWEKITGYLEGTLFTAAGDLNAAQE